MTKNKKISVEVNKLEVFLLKENVNQSKIINYKLFIEQILYGYFNINGNFKCDFKTLIKHKKHLIIISSKGINKNLLQSDVVVNNLMKNISVKALWKYKNHNNIIIIEVKTTTSSNLLEMYNKYLKSEKKKITIIVVFWFLGIITELTSPIINATLIEYIVDTEFNRIVLFSCLFSFTCILGHIFTIKLNKQLNNLFNIFLDKVQPDLAKNILNCKTECFDNNGSGFFIQILSNETKSIMNSFQQLYANLSSINSLIGIIIAYLILSPYIFFIEIIAVVGFLWIENYRTNRLNHADKKYRIVNDKFINFSNEIIKGVNDIKLLYRKKWVVNKFRELSESNNKLFVQMHNSSLNLKLLRRELAELWNFIFTIGIAFAIILWGFLPSTAIFILTYNTRIIYSASIIGNLMEIYKSINLSLDRIFSVLTNDSFVKDKFGDKVLNKIKGNLQLQDIKFSYKSQNALYKSYEVIKGISMNVKKGEKIAIVGKNGCGKTTLFNLITRLYDSYSGTITIDNFDIKNLSEKSLRSCISIVQQNSYVFNMSIIDNFHFVNSSLSEEEIIDICKKVNLNNDVLSLENGYNTVIGEDGQMLSGGQKQKLAIARCLARKSPIILLDEATSALDNFSQQKVLDTIFTLSASQTVLIIAHRLSTVVSCDRIYFMDNGKIIANGTHLQLINNCDEYKTLYNEEIKDKA